MMQQEKTVTFSLSHTRSLLMQQKLSNATFINKQNGRLMFAGTEYCIIDSNFRNWITAEQLKLASVCGTVYGREVILINPYCGNLAALLAAYIANIPVKNLKQDINDAENINYLLTHITVFIGQLLKPDTAVVQEIIDHYKTKSDHCLEIDNKFTPCIDLEIFLAKKIGVCRHHAVICCLLVASVINSGYLPPGEIILERTNLVDNAHATVHYVSNNVQWCLDPMKLFNQTTAHLAVTHSALSNAEELAPTLPLNFDNTPSSSQAC
jgi:hypothetical protein